MRLTLKLTAALAIVLAFQFALYGYLGAQRQVGYFEHDMRRDALQVGKTLAIAVERVWMAQGREAALALVDVTNDATSDTTIRFVWLHDRSDAAFAPALDERTLALIDGRDHLVTWQPPESEAEYIYTYVRVPLQTPQGAALELRESFDFESTFARASMLRAAVFLLIVVATTAVVMWLLGFAFIARPIQMLSKKARRIGQGDFSGELEVKGNDEIALLAREINQMSDQLETAGRLLKEETAKRMQALEQLRHADRLTTIGTLASGIAHELGTPLTVANGHLRALETKGADIPELIEIRSALKNQLEKMAGIVGQLLGFARRRTPEKHWSDLRDVVERVVQMLTPFGARRGVVIRAESMPNDASALVDANQFEQVLTNLLINAVQAMDSGEIVVGISTEETRNPENPDAPLSPHRKVSVRDNGAGMTPKQIEQIFDPFFTTKAPGQGTGMGLSIAHGIVREHGGWISVESAVGRGSCFFVYVAVGEAK